MKRALRSVVSVIAVASVLVLSAPAANAQAKHVRWDIVKFLSGTTVSAGGSASAIASDGSEITLTGTGTFVAPADGQGSSAVTGGGTWTIDTPPGSGTYTVDGFVRFDESTGTLSPLIDTIGEAEDAVAGLAVLTITYSDGDRGILVIGCSLVSGTPPSIGEGVTASKGPVDYFDREAAVFSSPGENLTAFHIAD